MVWSLGCNNPDRYQTVAAYPSIPSHFDSLIAPSDNPLTEESIELGNILFHDTRLSLDSSISCSSCHKVALAMADSLPISPGIKGRLGIRNAPSLLNAGYLGMINKDGGVRELDYQALTPIEDHQEMGISILEVSKRLKEDEAITQLASRAYNRDPDPYVITRSLGSFVRSLISGNAPYDDYINGDSTALTSQQIRGLNLFNSSRTNCSSCHIGHLFTNLKFEHNGTKSIYEDKGRGRITLQESDIGKFRVASLRNVILTKPYMFDGSFRDLDAVLEHYNNGGKPHKNKSDLIRPLGLSNQEKEDLKAFLKSLTDKSLATY